MIFFKKMTFGKFVLLFFLAIFVGVKTWYIWASQPLSVWQVTRRLNRCTEMSFHHISTEREKDTHGRRMNTYHFEDGSGIGFTVVSRVEAGDIGEPVRTTPKCDYLIAYAEAHQKYISQLLGQTGLAAEWGENDYGSLRFTIDVHSYADLENAAEAIENTLSSICIISKDYYLSGINFLYPEIYVQHYSGARVTSFPFRPVGEQTSPVRDRRVFDRLHERYLDVIRLGQIDEDLPDEIWWAAPRNIYNIYFDGEKIRGNQNQINGSMSYFCYDTDLKEYTVWLFNDHSILTWYVDKRGGSYNFDELEATWTIGKDNWVATLYKEVTEHPNDSNEKTTQPTRTITTKLERVKKNGKILDIHNTCMTLPELAIMLDLTFEVNQMEDAIYFWSSSDK